jgi:hypothetical protein
MDFESSGSSSRSVSVWMSKKSSSSSDDIAEKYSVVVDVVELSVAIDDAINTSSF